MVSHPGNAQEQVARPDDQNSKAHEFYVQGNNSFRGQTKAGMLKSIEFYEQAIKTDPNYALAYTGLARAYFALGMRGFLSPKESQPKDEAAALKSVELDNSLAEAHAALGAVKQVFHWDWDGAEKEFKRALELNPNSAEARLLYVDFLQYSGRPVEAVGYATPIAPTLESISYLRNRQFEKLIEILLKAKESRPDRGDFHLAVAYIGAGKYGEAITEMQKVIANARDKEPERWDRYPILAYAYAAAGKRDEALKILNEQNELAKTGYISPYNFAIIYTGLGDKDKAFEYLKKTYEQHVPVLHHFPSWSLFDPLHSDRRFAELVRRMNLPPERFLKTVRE